MVPSRAEGRGLAFEVGRRHPRGKQFREAEAGEEQGPTDLISFGQGPSQLSRCETCSVGNNISPIKYVRVRCVCEDM